MTSLNQDEILKQLSLQPIEFFQEKARVNPEYPRRSGRTTAMLVDAIATASRGSSVLLVMHSEEMVSVMENWRDDAIAKLNRPDLKLKILVGKDTPYISRGFLGLELRDHVVQGSL
jgi:hypothetical protein